MRLHQCCCGLIASHQSRYDKAWTKFLDAVFAAVIRHVDFSIVKCLVVAVGLEMCVPSPCRPSKPSMPWTLKVWRELQIRSFMDSSYLLVAAQGPGFAKDQFKEFLETEAVRREVRTLIENRDKVCGARIASAPSSDR